MIRLAVLSDVTAWLEIAAEVEKLFGNMVDDENFVKGITKSIDEKSALCAMHTDGSVAGIIALDIPGNEIAWLAVKHSFRGYGYGSALLNAALERLDKTKPIYVQTFSSAYSENCAARKLYTRHGFVDYKESGKNPAGIETVVMMLKAL